jgi:hypothetical protein
MTTRAVPDVLPVDEVRRLIAAVRTPHNQAYSWTVDSRGLRLEEGLQLQAGDINGDPSPASLCAPERPRGPPRTHYGTGPGDRPVAEASDNAKLGPSARVRPG